MGQRLSGTGARRSTAPELKGRIVSEKRTTGVRSSHSVIPSYKSSELTAYEALARVTYALLFSYEY